MAVTTVFQRVVSKVEMLVALKVVLKVEMLGEIMVVAKAVPWAVEMVAVMV